MNVVTIRTPMLQEIREDIPLLVSHFTQAACREMDVPLKKFSAAALEVMMARPWPGNIREMQNFVRRAVVFSPENIIRPEDLESSGETAGPPNTGQPAEEILGGKIEPYKVAKERLVNDFTSRYVADLLEKTQGNITRAAELSGLSRVALQKILRRLSGYS